MWDLANLQEVTTLKGHNHWVRAMAVRHNCLYTGSYNQIKVCSMPECIVVWNNNVFSFSICVENVEKKGVRVV